ncbi:MAG: hypothetical protein LUD48_00340, partial [Prevotella sp.]|nr:hypothetical protein [Prevotella sp.]
MPSSESKMLNTTPLSSYSDQSYHWYVVHTDNQQYLKRVLTGRDGIEEIYLPMEHVKAKDTTKLKTKVLLTTYLFVYAIESCIRSELEMFDAQLELDSHRDYKQPMIITDEDMDTFKTMCEHHLDIERLRNPYVTFFKNDRARIMVGPFVGFEGFIMEIKGDLKLITQLGDWTVAISNIQKYDIEIISNRSSHTTEAARFARLADYFQELLLGHDVQDNFHYDNINRVNVYDNEAKTQLKIHVATDRVDASRILRQLISGLHRYSTKEHFLKSLSQKHNNSTHDTQIMLEFLNALSYNDEAMLMHMIQYIYSKDPKAIIEESIPDTPFRPFLTITPGAEMHPSPKVEAQNNENSNGNQQPNKNTTACPTPSDDVQSHIANPIPTIVNHTNLNCDEKKRYIANPIPTVVNHPSLNCTEWIYEVSMTEGEYDQKTGKTEMRAVPYYAHVAIMPQGTDKIRIMTNWGDFFKKYELWQPSERTNFLDKLEKYALTHFHAILNGTSLYTVMTTPIGTGIGIIINQNEDIESAIKILISK